MWKELVSNLVSKYPKMSKIYKHVLFSTKNLIWVNLQRIVINFFLVWRVYSLYKKLPILYDEYTRQSQLGERLAVRYT